MFPPHNVGLCKFGGPSAHSLENTILNALNWKLRFMTGHFWASHGADPAGIEWGSKYWSGRIKRARRTTSEPEDFPHSLTCDQCLIGLGVSSGWGPQDLFL